MKKTFQGLVQGLEQNTSLVVLIILFVLFSLFVPNFTNARNLTAVTSQLVVTGFLALGQLLVILTGGIDLSQGSLVAMTSIVVSVTMRNYGLAAAVAAGIAGGVAVGVFNGLLVAKVKMPAFIVTLGTMGIVRGIALMLANAKPVPITDSVYKLLGSARISWVPVSSILLLAASLIMHFFLKLRRSGRYLYAIGSNERNTLLSGIDVSRYKLMVYILSAFFVTLGGMIWCSRLVSGSPVGGVNYETESIAAVIVGGASLSGGEGTVFGTLYGVLILQCIGSMLNLTGINPFWQGVVKGVLIIAAVILSIFRNSGALKQI
ncbi:MAG: ABC transporter permease [Treponema sp.]|jgi:ribose transport system permease protein|nr:ABC transporter permease [Treponema sp.]